MKASFIAVLLLFHLGIMFKADAAYIYYQARGDSPLLSSGEKQRLMSIVMKYQYPMSLAYFHHPDIRDPTRLSDILFLKKNTEGKFLNKKFQDYEEPSGHPLQNIRAVFISDTLFQYIHFFLFLYDKEIRKKTENLSDIVEGSFQEVEDMALQGGEEMSKYYNYFQLLHSSSEFKELFHALNEKMVKLIFDDLKIGRVLSKGGEQKEFILEEEDLYNRFDVILKLLTEMAQNQRVSILYYKQGKSFEDLNLNPDRHEILTTAIRYEYEAYKNFKTLLFRGTNLKPSGIVDSIAMITGDSLDVKVKPISVSYGMTLLSGIINEETACAFCYYVKQPFGYALTFNLADILNNKYDFMKFSPLSPVVTLAIQWWEFWHARTKIGAFCNFGRQSGELVVGELCGVFDQQAGQNIKHEGVIITPKATILLAVSFSKHLEKNIIVFKNQSGRTDWMAAQHQHTKDLEKLEKEKPIKHPR